MDWRENPVFLLFNATPKRRLPEMKISINGSLLFLLRFSIYRTAFLKPRDIFPKKNKSDVPKFF
jgi:hypothetical protein